MSGIPGNWTTTYLDLGQGFIQLGLVSSDNDHVGAFLSKDFRYAFAHALRATCEKDGLGCSQMYVLTKLGELDVPCR